MTGYSTSDIVGWDIAVLYHLDETRANRPAEDLHAAARERNIETEGWRIRKGGQMIWAETAFTVMRGADETVTCFVCTLRGLTDMEAAEARKRARAERLATLGATSGAMLRCLRLDATHDSPEIRADLFRRHAFRSVMAMPLTHDRATIGCLALFAHFASAFDDEKAFALEVESEFGKGVTFRITLFREADPAAAAGRPRPSPTSASR